MSWRWLTLLVVIVAAACATPAIPERADLRDSIHAARAELFQAMREKDTKKLDRLLDDEFTFTHSTGLVENKTTFVARLMAARMPPPELEFSDEDIRVRGNLVLWHTQSHRKAAAGDTRLYFRALDVLEWQDGRWRWLAVHSTRVAGTQ